MLASEFLVTYCLPLLVCCLGSVVLDFFAKPKVKPLWLRGYLAITVQLLLLGVMFTLFLLVTRRPIFSIAGCLCIAFVVLIINNVKYVTLREPLAFSDFFLYLQIFQYPRFYLPFLGGRLLTLLLLVGGGVILAGFTWEAAAFSFISPQALFFLILLMVKLWVLSKLCLKVPISIILERDCEQLGILAAACVYAYKAPKHKENLHKIVKDESVSSKQSIDSPPKGTALADIVVVQSESFFDARCLDATIIKDVLSGYDHCLSSSRAFGKLEVPAWGANTMRTEFGFLTGLTPQQLGLAQFYPYQQLAGLQVPSIVSALKALGYHCICIHPNAANFFMRATFFKQLGFDEFLDEASFEGAVREGPYIADAAVTEKIIHVLEEREKPCFVFAITMENHGPLHLETLVADEWVNYYKEMPDTRLNELTIYLRHLNNADKMISQLCEYFSTRNQPAIFSFYGDHVPAISKVFELMGYNDPCSNYFIWSTSGRKILNSEVAPTKKMLKIEALGQHLLDLIGSQ